MGCFFDTDVQEAVRISIGTRPSEVKQEPERVELGRRSGSSQPRAAAFRQAGPAFSPHERGRRLKLGLLADDQRPTARQLLLDDLDWDGPVFEISAITGQGTEKLAQAVMLEFERMDEDEAEKQLLAASEPSQSQS